MWRLFNVKTKRHTPAKRLSLYKRKNRRARAWLKAMHGNAGGQGAQGRSHKIINTAVRWWWGGGVEEHRATRAGSADTVFSLFGSLCRDFPFRFNCLPHWQSQALFSLSSAAITLIRSNNLKYLGNVFQAKRRDVGF